MQDFAVHCMTGSGRFLIREAAGKRSKGDGISDAVQEVGIVSNMKFTAKEIVKLKEDTGESKMPFTMCWMTHSAKTDRPPKAVKIILR